MYRTCLGHVKGLHAFRQSPSRFIFTRNISWRSQARSTDASEHFDKEQEIERSTILDKVMKGRQPTELMLRCTLHRVSVLLTLLTLDSGTVLDAEGRNIA